jgi:hypothetical protein
MRKINKQFVAYEVNENDTATRQQDIITGHQQYEKHIQMVRKRLGLDADCVCCCDARTGE